MGVGVEVGVGLSVQNQSYNLQSSQPFSEKAGETLGSLQCISSFS